MVGVGAFTENFRSALNGYNRTDVVQFIQRQTIEHEKAMRLLREENARLKQAAAEPGDKGGDRQAEIDELNRRIVALTQQNSELRVQNKTLSDEKEALESTLETTRLSLAAAEEAALAAVSQPPKAVPTLDRPIAPPMGLVSPPGGFDELELAAYRRAEHTERMARKRAEEASERMQSIFMQADEKLALHGADINLAFDSLRSSYEQMQALMEATKAVLAESCESLKASAELSGMV